MVGCASIRVAIVAESRTGLVASIHTEIDRRTRTSGSQVFKAIGIRQCRNRHTRCVHLSAAEGTGVAILAKTCHHHRIISVGGKSSERGRVSGKNAVVNHSAPLQQLYPPRGGISSVNPGSINRIRSHIAQCQSRRLWT